MLHYKPDVSVITKSGSSLLSLTIDISTSSAIRTFVRTLFIKEELTQKVFHPKRVNLWLKKGGDELFDMMF
jgi:hypothetical protein